MFMLAPNSLRALPLSFSLAALLQLSVGCNGATLGRGGDEGDGQGDGGTEDGGSVRPPVPPKIPGCVGACVVNSKCSPAMGPTTLTGVVTIPSGNLPLYNAKVYIPTGDALPPPPQSGPSCDLCDTAPALFSTSTDINGRFTLTNVPSGQNIPLIIRVGKWRRVVTIPSVTDCTSTPLDPAMTRLPRNQSEGNIPRIALSTGNADALECILRNKKLGLDDSEFTPETGTGRVNLYAGANGANKYAPTLNGGAAFTAAKVTPAASWWDSSANWSKYDIVMLSCEGSPLMEYKSAAALANLEKYIGDGGRVFASHWHNGWIANAKSPQKIQTVATFPNVGDLGSITETIDTSFTKGSALADWLILPEVWGPGQPPMRGQLPVVGAKNTIGTIAMKLTQRWVYASASTPQYFSFNAPIGATADKQCGQMVFTDLHVSSGTGGDASSDAVPFPNGCKANTLSAQEKALIFMLFDLTNCLQPPIG